jgi:hypothetical protein
MVEVLLEMDQMLLQIQDQAVVVAVMLPLGMAVTVVQEL